MYVTREMKNIFVILHINNDVVIKERILCNDIEYYAIVVWRNTLYMPYLGFCVNLIRQFRRGESNCVHILLHAFEIFGNGSAQEFHDTAYGLINKN